MQDHGKLRGCGKLKRLSVSVYVGTLREKMGELVDEKNRIPDAKFHTMCFA